MVSALTSMSTLLRSPIWLPSRMSWKDWYSVSSWHSEKNVDPPRLDPLTRRKSLRDLTSRIDTPEPMLTSLQHTERKHAARVHQ